MLGFEFSDAAQHPGQEIGTHFKTAKELGYLDLLKSFHSVWTYTDIIVHRAVSNSQVPLLRTVMIEGFGDCVIHKVFTHPYYITASKSFFSKIEIQFLDNTGNKIKFLPRRSHSGTLLSQKAGDDGQKRGGAK